jgi:hypothetical protein
MAQLTLTTRSAVSSIWQKLTAPHPSITDIEQRRQSRLLAGFILVLATVFTVMATRGVLVEHDMVGAPILFSNVAILAFEFFLNRRGKYKTSAYLFVILAFIFIHILSLTSMGAMSRMFYIALAILVSAILLSLRTTFLLAAASVGLQLFFALTAPRSSEVVNSAPLFFTLVIAPIVLIFTEHRAGLERERQAELQAANAGLREAEASLEKRVAERTRDLQVAADVSRQITTILELRELLQAVVERTKVGFKLYHVSVFLYDAELQGLSLGAGGQGQS